MYDDKSRKDLERLAGLYKDKGHSKYVDQHKYMWIQFLAGGWVNTIDKVLNNHIYSTTSISLLYHPQFEMH